MLVFKQFVPVFVSTWVFNTHHKRLIFSLKIYWNIIKVRITQKMLVKWSKCHSSEPFFAPEEGGKFKLMNGTYKMLILSFFCVGKINL